MSLRVLVVDDDHDSADSLSHLIRLWGYECEAAYDGATAIGSVISYQPHLMLVDLAMPRTDGLSVAREMRKHETFRSIRLVALTGYADGAHREMAMDAGFEQFFAKPIETSDLEEFLRQAEDGLVQAE